MDSPADDALEAVVATLSAEVGLLRVRADRRDAECATLRRRLDRLERRGRGPRDQADQHMLEALVSIAGEVPFSSGDVRERGRLDPAFDGLLLDAGLESDVAIGYLLRRCRGSVISGYRLERLSKGAIGALWAWVKYSR